MSDPFSGGFDPSMFAGVPLFQEFAKVLSWSGGPVNWDLARQTAASVAGGGRPGGEQETRRLPVGFTAGGGSPPRKDDADLAAAVSTAELWLDDVTELPAVDGPVRALEVLEWVRLATTSEGLGVYVEPVAEGMADALGKGLPEELRSALGDAGAGQNPLAGMLGPLGAMLYGIQAGTVAGHLGTQLLGTYDLGLPTLDPRTVGTVGDTAVAFGREFGFDPTELRFALALRETAHRRQFAGVPWLRGHVSDLIRRFAAGADLDPSRMMDQLGGLGLDPSALHDPVRMRQAMSSADAFRIEPTEAQRQVLSRLQALVAFTEAWVDTVARAAAGGRLPSLGRIEEALRRRRAEKGPGERFLEQLVGLDLKPADVRAGEAFCQAVLGARGQAGLDRAWRSAETLPSAAELAEPSRWLVRLAAEEVEEVEAHVEAGLDDLPSVPDDLSGLDEDRDDEDRDDGEGTAGPER